MSNCEPYHKWLGIPENELPPNHYRLLGIPLFECDPEVIENAADQRSGYLRSFHNSQHVDVAERMLNEVAAAKICLLRPGRREKYDAVLRASVHETSMLPTHPAPAPAPLPVPALAPLPQRVPQPLRLSIPVRVPFLPPFPSSSPPPELPPSEAPVFFDQSYYTLSVVDLPPFRNRTPHRIGKRFNPIIVMAPLYGVVLLALAVAYKNFDTIAASAPPRPGRRAVAEKLVPIAQTPNPTTHCDPSLLAERKTDALHIATAEPDIAPASTNRLVRPVAERPNAAYPVLNQLPLWVKVFRIRAAAGIECLELWRNGLAKSGSRQLAILAKAPARVVSPVVLRFDEDETRIEIPIAAKIPADRVLSIAAWTDGKIPARKTFLQETPDPITVTFDANPHKTNPGLVVIRITARIGSGADEIPCNWKRLASMADDLPGQIQDTQDKLAALSKDISKAESNYANVVSQSASASPTIAVAQQASATAAKSKLEKLRKNQAFLIRSGRRMKAELHKLQELIKLVKGWDGTTFQYRVYYLEPNRQIALAESADDW